MASRGCVGLMALIKLMLAVLVDSTLPCIQMRQVHDTVEKMTVVFSAKS